MAVHTIGGVVTPAQTLMVVVPEGSKLQIEAMLPNRDVGFVRPGQPAEVKVDAFTYARYGLLHGTVDRVSRDMVQGSDHKGGNAAGRNKSVLNAAKGSTKNPLASLHFAPGVRSISKTEYARSNPTSPLSRKPKPAGRR
jgi:hemolysin D